MRQGLFFAGIILVVLIVVVVKKKREGYGTVLGQLAPYQKHLSECINQCNREDPNRRLLAGSNINCGVYCESVVTEMAQRGIPPESIEIVNEESVCKKQCSGNLPSGRTPTKQERDKCESMCQGQQNVAKYCSELWCPYSVFPRDECMKMCFDTATTNNNQVSWKWDMAR